MIRWETGENQPSAAHRAELAKVSRKMAQLVKELPAPEPSRPRRDLEARLARLEDRFAAGIRYRDESVESAVSAFEAVSGRLILLETKVDALLDRLDRLEDRPARRRDGPTTRG